MNVYITEPADVASIKAGTARLSGKQVLAVDSDLKTATARIFRALSENPNLAIVSGQGLSCKGSTNTWKRISVPELEKLLLEQFVLAKPEVGEGGRTRFKILDEPPNPIWIATLTQNRWLTDEVQSWFPAIEQTKVQIIKNP